MATHKGSEGLVKIGANTVAEVTSFSVSETADTIDTTELSDTAKSFDSDLTSWTANVEAHYDETDTNGQQAMTIGASVTLNLYPEGADTSDTFATGTALITSLEVNNSSGETVKAVFQAQGSGALVWGTVA